MLPCKSFLKVLTAPLLVPTQVLCIVKAVGFRNFRSLPSMLKGYSYANCLLATLNFRLVLRKQSDPNLTEIVWDDMETNIRSTQSSPHQSMRVM